jgi:hypothetical protein
VQTPFRYVPDTVVSPEPHTLYRRHDPDTSRQAAESIQPHLTEIQKQVLHLIELAGFKGLTDEELSEIYGTAGSTARTRRAELAKQGLVVEAKEKRMLRSGQQGRVWIAATQAKGYQACLL